MVELQKTVQKVIEVKKTQHKSTEVRVKSYIVELKAIIQWEGKNVMILTERNCRASKVNAFQFCVGSDNTIPCCADADGTL